jgi:hypothetical protein
MKTLAPIQEVFSECFTKPINNQDHQMNTHALKINKLKSLVVVGKKTLAPIQEVFSECFTKPINNQDHQINTHALKINKLKRLSCCRHENTSSHSGGLLRMFHKTYQQSRS